MKIIISILLLLTSVFSDMLKVGDRIDFSSINNQFDKPLEVTNETKKIIFALEKETAEAFVEFMDKNPKYLIKQKAIYIADVGKAPSFVRFLFIIPKLRRYDFSIGVMKIEDMKFKVPKSTKKYTILSLENQNIKKIQFIKKIKK